MLPPCMLLIDLKTWQMRGEGAKIVFKEKKKLE